MAYYNFKTQGNVGASAYYLGTLAHGSTMNVAAKYDGYATLTSANFVIMPLAASASSSNIEGKTHHFDHDRDECDISVAGSASLSTPNINYNPSTGSLSFSMVLSQWSGGGVWSSTSEIQSSSSSGVSARVYLLPEIETL